MRGKVLIAVVLLVVLTCVMLSGCTAFEDLFNIIASGGSGDSGDGGSSENGIKSVNVNFHIGDRVQTEKINIGEEYKASIPVKNGYYLTGYFTQPNGGEMYFDEFGRSISVWSEDYPTDFYAQWKSVSGYKIYNIDSSDKTYSSIGSVKVAFQMEDHPTIVLSGNLNCEVVVSISYRIKEVYTKYYPTVTSYLYIMDGDDSSSDILYSTSFQLDCGDYHLKTFTFKCEARELSSGNIYMQVSSDSGYLADKIHIKDIIITAQFV
ncbi:MAG: hypothetical protein IJX60_03970 [Paludibacteraceae bacterium]|nr:hypothetical protein [Paludibacteraceae bacterium]